MRRGLSGGILLLLLVACHAPPSDVVRLPAGECRAGICRSQAIGLQVTLRFLEPPNALQAFRFRVEPAGFSAPVESVHVSFVMSGMDMGRNEYRLQKQPDGYSGRAILPLCTTGRNDWLAVVTLASGPQHYEARFAFQAAGRQR